MTTEITIPNLSMPTGEDTLYILYAFTCIFILTKKKLKYETANLIFSTSSTQNLYTIPPST